MTALPTNWWEDPASIPAPTQEAEWTRIEWMRPDPAPKPTPPVRRPQRPRPALRLADGMVDLGERLLLWLLGFSIGSALVVLVNHLAGAS